MLNLSDSIETVLKDGSRHYIVDTLIFLASFLVNVLFSPYLMRFHLFRRLVRPIEKYCGCYVQIIFHTESLEDEWIDYSILNINYNIHRGKYVLLGKNYDQHGKLKNVFTSHLVDLKRDILTSIEFIWKLETGIEQYAGTRRSNDGYTEMVINDPANLRRIDGSGFIISFRQNTTSYDYLFFKLTNKWAGGISTDPMSPLRPPRSERDRMDFVVRLHSALQQSENDRLTKRHTDMRRLYSK